MERIEIHSGYVSEMSAGSFIEPYSFLQATERAQDIGSRLMSNTEYQIAINGLENRLPDKSALEALSSLYGNNFGSPGYAGARTMTGTIVEKDGTVTDVDSVFEKYLYGSKQYYGKQLTDLLNLARQMQEKGKISYIKEFDESKSLPVAISSEPNPKYHNAVFYVSPSVKETGVVVRGIHHSVGEPSAKYNVAILPLDYKDIMLGHRTVSDTNRAKLTATAGITAALTYELADNVFRGKISAIKALNKISSHIHDNIRDRKMSRRAFTAAIGLFSFYLAGCGGGGSTNPSPSPPPPLPPAPAFTYSGSVLKRIADDGSKVGQGSVRLEGIPGTFTGNIDSAGNFSIAGVKAGTYKRTTSDGASDSVYVPQAESIVQISGNLTGQNYSIIERGANRFGVPFDNNFQAFYEKLAQRNHQINPGVIKWGNDPNQMPIEVTVVESTIPEDVRGNFINQLTAVIGRDTATFSGEKISNLSIVAREQAQNLAIQTLFEEIDAAGLTDYPILDGKRIVQARTRFKTSTVSDALRRGEDRSRLIAHEYGHCWGAQHPDIEGILSVMNTCSPVIGIFCAEQPTDHDRLAFFIYNHRDVKSGNTAPDTNP